MSQKFPADDFDFVTEVGGRHRAKRGGADRLLEFTQVIFAGAALSAAGFFALQLVAANGNLGLDTPLPLSTKAANQFTKGNGIAVSVIDASKATDAASKLAQKLLDDGWNVWTASRNVSGQGNPSVLKTTTVYATSDANVSIAKKLAATLGNYETVVSTTYNDPITIVLGADYNK